VFAGDPDAVVGDGEPPPAVVGFGPHQDLGCHVGGDEGEGVANEVGEHLAQLGAVGVEHGQGAAAHDRGGFVDPAVQVGQHRVEHLLRVDGGERLRLGVDPAVGEHVGDELLHAGGTGGDEKSSASVSSLPR
jgi:hypothetical protein